jgi:energy-coupling factor transport system ATP-binding protein
VDVQIDDIWYRYPNGVNAVRGVSLTIPAGARLALLGQNGAGKTTLVKHIDGLVKPTRGAVRVGDWDTREHSIARLSRRVGFVFQNPDEQLFKTRVWDEVAFGPSTMRLDAREVERRVRETLEECELENFAEAHPYDLPPWQRRWVAIASTLALQSPVLIFDEPTTGQDAEGLARLRRVLDELTRRGVTLITVTHDVDFAAENFPEIVIMANGVVLERGTPEILSHQEILTRAGLEAPQLMRLAHALNWDEHPPNEDEFLEIYRRRKIPAEEGRIG